MKYYCQEDGGQWNVEVYLLWEAPAIGVSVISGANLMSQCTINDGFGVLAVRSNTVFDTPQGDNVMEFKR